MSDIWVLVELDYTSLADLIGLFKATFSRRTGTTVRDSDDRNGPHGNVISMLIGTGVDLIEIERIAQSIERYGNRFLRRIFTDHEIEYCSRKRSSAESFAARFAAKEAGAKALGTGISRGVTWNEFQVEREPGGRPTLQLRGRAALLASQLGVRCISLSLTHTATLAMASVMMED
jgi:holo-[acyl-carrier protein] synthase